MIDLTLLGCGGYMPLPSRRLTACALRSGGFGMLIDCGEGTQLAIRESGLTMKPISAILLTHYHADHIAGLPGMLLSMGNENRREPVDVYGPEGLEKIAGAIRAFAPELPFEIRLHPLKMEEASLSVGPYTVTAFPLQHRVPCLGYCVELPRAGKFSPEKARENGVPVEIWSRLQKSGDAEWNGTFYTRDMVMGGPRRGIKLLYATDTRPVPAIARIGKNADLMILEGMYGDPEKQARCEESSHMLMNEAAQLAAEAHAEVLWFTHYSPALTEPEEALIWPREIFPACEAGCDGKRTQIKFKND